MFDTRVYDMYDELMMGSTNVMRYSTQKYNPFRMRDALDKLTDEVDYGTYMAKKSKTDSKSELYKQQKKWYAKLKKEGFDDIEGGKPGMSHTPYLKRHSIEMKDAYNPASEEYYRRCRIHVQHGTFDSNLQRYVFECHSEGHSMRKIIKMIRSRFKRKRSVFFVHDHIHKCIKAMAIERHWEEEEEVDNLPDAVELGKGE